MEKFKLKPVNSVINSYYLLLFFNASLSVVFIYFEYKVSSLYYYFSFCIFGAILFNNRINLIFFIRTIFLGIMGFLAFGTKLIDEGSLFGYHLRESQTLEIATLMFLLTNIALFASEIGFLVASKIKIKQKNKIVLENKSFFYIVFGLLIFVGYLIASTRGLIVGGNTSYGDGSSTSPVVGNFNTISNILFFSLLLLFYKFKDLYHWNVDKLKYFLIFGGFYLFIYAEFLRGVRMDALNGLFGIVIIYYVYNNKPLQINLKISIIGITAFIFIQIMGMIRSALQFLTTSELIVVIQNGFRSLTEGSSSGILFYQGTINDIATTFSGIIMLLQNKVIDFYYGSSYFDYILRTPPQFLYPDRPKDLAWLFVDNGYSSGGGFFELAEAYLNFGVIGAFIVPFIISFLFGYAYKSFYYNRYSLIHSILLFSLLASFMRSILYQSFALYKSAITGFIIIGIYYIVLYILKRYRKIQKKALSL